VFTPMALTLALKHFPAEPNRRAGYSLQAVT